MAQRRRKVYAYITRRQGDRTQVLVFDHVDFPEAGTQVPGGSVEEGEPLEQAVLREVFEEAGLAGMTVVRYLGTREFYVPERSQVHERHFFHLVASRPLPDSWIHTVSDGVGDKGLRFRYFWMDVQEAAALLAGQQGACLDALLEQAPAE